MGARAVPCFFAQLAMAACISRTPKQQARHCQACSIHNTALNRSCSGSQLQLRRFHARLCATVAWCCGLVLVNNLMPHDTHLQHQHLLAAISCQPIGKHTASSSATNNDVVVLLACRGLHHHCCAACSCISSRGDSSTDAMKRPDGRQCGC